MPRCSPAPRRTSSRPTWSRGLRVPAEPFAPEPLQGPAASAHPARARACADSPRNRCRCRAGRRTGCGWRNCRPARRDMMPTCRRPATIRRWPGPCPCTSALGLSTRRYSAGRQKRAPSSKSTSSRFSASAQPDFRSGDARLRLSSGRASSGSMIGMPSRIGIGEPGLAADQLVARRGHIRAAPWSPGRPGSRAGADRSASGGARIGSAMAFLSPCPGSQLTAAGRACHPRPMRPRSAAARAAHPPGPPRLGASSSACFSAARTGRPCRA